MAGKGKKGAKAAETGGRLLRLRLGLALYMHLRDTENSYRYSTGQLAVLFPWL